jgi:hypothetical protein
MDFFLSLQPWGGMLDISKNTIFWYWLNKLVHTKYLKSAFDISNINHNLLLTSLFLISFYQNLFYEAEDVAQW